MSEATFTGARHQRLTRIEEVKDNGRSIVFDGGTHYGGVPAEHQSKMKEGLEVVFETRGGSIVLGMAIVDGSEEWLFRKSDQQIEEERLAYQERLDARRRETLEANRADMEAREAALPEAFRKRIERFRNNGGERFELSGWNYELVISQLAVAYASSDRFETNDEVRRIDELYGASNNQHEAARWFAKLYLDDQLDAIEAEVAGMAPITGDPDYTQG